MSGGSGLDTGFDTGVAAGLDPGTRTGVFGGREVALVDLLDRLLAGGVVLVGDVTISLAGVDLVRVSLRALITSISPVEDEPPSGPGT